MRDRLWNPRDILRDERLATDADAMIWFLRGNGRAGKRTEIADMGNACR